MNNTKHFKATVLITLPLIVILVVLTSYIGANNNAKTLHIEADNHFKYADWLYTSSGITPITNCSGDTDKLAVTGVSIPINAYGRNDIVECTLYFESEHENYAFTAYEYSNGKPVNAPAGSYNDDCVYAERTDSNGVVTRCRAELFLGMHYSDMVPNYQSLHRDEDHITLRLFTDAAGIYRVTCFFRDSIRRGIESTTGKELYSISFSMFIPDMSDKDFQIDWLKINQRESIGEYSVKFNIISADTALILDEQKIVLEKFVDGEWAEQTDGAILLSTLNTKKYEDRRELKTVTEQLILKISDVHTIYRLALVFYNDEDITDQYTLSLNLLFDE